VALQLLGKETQEDQLQERFLVEAAVAALVL
jgi:hypothetical protein